MNDTSATIDPNDVILENITADTLRLDTTGALIERMADLAYHAFREPPWNDDLEKPRLHFGLGADLMRRNAMALIAKAKVTSETIGYTLGYEIFRQSDDPRDLTLGAISGSGALDELFEAGERIFYGDTLCVDPAYRRRNIAFTLTASQIDRLRREGFAYRIGRTSIASEPMKALYAKLGFWNYQFMILCIPNGNTGCFGFKHYRAHCSQRLMRFGLSNYHRLRIASLYTSFR
ncbi:MAG: GNAT family N-acetyltransferase [Methylomicrobium sp.]